MAFLCLQALHFLLSYLMSSSILLYLLDLNFYLSVLSLVTRNPISDFLEKCDALSYIFD
jgi:hypothetical protein